MTASHYSRLLVCAVVSLALLACCAASAATITVPCGSTNNIPCLIGSPSNIWNVGNVASQPLDADSAGMISDLNAEVATEQSGMTGPSIITSQQILLAPANAPTVNVRILDVPRNYLGLRADTTAVPVPQSGFVTTGDADKETVVWQGNRMWEFWGLSQAADGSWQAHWGGYMPSVNTDPGYYSAANNTDDFGATASGLPLAYGEVTPNWDYNRAGGIGHALALNIPHARQGVYSLPAQRDDGTSSDPESLPEGAILRLDPSYDISQILVKCPGCEYTYKLAQAAQKYGIIVRDQTGADIGFVATDPTAYGHPNWYYVGGSPRSNGPFAGYWPTTLMHYFPWSALQVVQLNCQPTACA